jgi:hypothetical protein
VDVHEDDLISEILLRLKELVISKIYLEIME